MVEINYILARRFREVLNLIAEGDEIILRLEPDIIEELRHSGLITRAYKNRQFEYSVTERGYRALARKS